MIGMLRSILFITFGLVALISSAQKHKWSAFTGIGISGNSEMFYIGPSAAAGVQTPIGKRQKWHWAPEVQFFQKKQTETISEAETEYFKFTSFSVRSNFNYYFGKKPGQGFFAGAGFGFQHASDDSRTEKDNGQIKETIPGEYVYSYSRLMPTINIGHSAALKKGRYLQTVLSGIGPYHANHGSWSCTEIISVLSLQLRLVW